MKKIPIILLSLTCVCLFALCAFLGINHKDLITDNQELKDENKTLHLDLTNLNTKISDDAAYLTGQEEYIAELTRQLAELQAPDDSDSEKETKSPDSKDKYPDMYPQKPSDGEGTSEKVVYLTFDDGPSALTPEVLDLLDEYDAKATFFVVYTDTSQYTSNLKEIVSRGHTLAIHSYSHDYDKIYNSVDAFLSDFEKVFNWVSEETGVKPALYRFPGGSIKGSTSVVNGIVKEMNRRGFIYYDWNVSSGDGSSATTQENILENVTTAVKDFKQPVVLMHDGPGNTATKKALPAVLKTLSKDGYAFRSLDEYMKPVQYNRKANK